LPRLELDDKAIRALESPGRGQINYIGASLPGFGLRVAAAALARGLSRTTAGATCDELRSDVILW
jgi:hypothetical protein